VVEEVRKRCGRGGGAIEDVRMRCVRRGRRRRRRTGLWRCVKRRSAVGGGVIEEVRGPEAVW
jgi:hypothetical protein